MLSRPEPERYRFSPLGKAPGVAESAALAMSAPEPTITGDLERTPFFHVLISLHTRRVTGTLAIWPETDVRGQDRIYFKDGVPVSARFLAADTPLLDRALGTVFPRKRGAFAFYEGHDLVGDEAMRGKIELFALLAASLRTGVRAEALEAVLAQHEGGMLRVAPGFDFKRYALLPKEERLLEVARAGASSVAELIDACELGPEIGRRLVYLWLATQALVPYAGTPSSAAPRPSVSPATSRPRTPTPPAGSTPPASVPPGVPTPVPPRSPVPPSRSHSGSMPAIRMSELPLPPSGPPSDAPPAGLSGDALAFFTELRQRTKQIDTQNYYEMLGVPRDAGSDAVRKQFLHLAKRWHPDRLPPELTHLRAEAQQIFHHLTAAHDTLVDEAKRAAYLKTVQDGGGTPEADRKLAAVVTAAMEQQKAEVLMRRRDFAGARNLLEHALSLSGDDADLHVSYAWALLHVESGGSLLPDVVRHLDRAITMAPKHDRAHFYRGLALRRLGKEAEALAAFRAAAEANPKNLDAAREVRLAKMRGQLSPPAKEKPADESFFSKLFGSSKKKP